MSHFYNEAGDLVEPWEGGYPSPSTILDIIANPGIEANRRRMGDEAADELMIAAQQRGTRVHKACELWLQNGRDMVLAGRAAKLLHEEIAYLVGFVNWWEKYQPTLIASENFLINHALGYAGTTDLIVELDGQPWIIDIKTGVTRAKHGLQVKYYAEAYREALPGHPKVRMGGLYLDPTRACGYRYFKSEYGMLEYKESLAAIKAHLSVYRWWAKKEPIKQPKEVVTWEG